jgi:molybdopterin-binding protein
LTLLAGDCDNGTISGKITDAVSGNIVQSVVLSVYKGSEFISSVTTNSSGEYELSNMSPGWYIMYSSKDGYIDENFMVYSCGTQEDQDNSISTDLATGAMRIILKWPKTDPVTARDLDSYLYSPNGSGGWHKIYYGKLIKRYGADGRVTLDKDDTEQLGAPPGDETITISKIRSGTYHFKVYNYTDSEGDNATAKKTNLKNSKATVKVYYNDGNSITKKDYPVTNDNGTLWYVFTFDNSSGFTEVNTMSNP